MEQTDHPRFGDFGGEKGPLDGEKKKLIEILQKLVNHGNTVVVIEHNMDIIKSADYIIDFGPDGGNGGGIVIAKGTPEQVAETKKSYTGEYLKKVLRR